MSRPVRDGLSSDPAGLPVDVVILTARADEHTAMVNAVGHCTSRPSPDGELTFGDIRGLRALLFPMDHMGNAAAAQAAESVIHSWRPGLLLLAGIAGGARGSSGDMRPGDILVPDQVVGYELAKVTSSRLERRYEVYRTDPDLLRLARGLRPSDWADEILVPRPECNGVHGSGLSGIVGVGPNCDRDRATADQFASQSHVSQLESQLAALNQKIDAQTLTAGSQGQSYATAVTSGIAKLVAAKKASEGRIGLLNRIDALGTLAGKNFVILLAAVLLGLFIVTVDCLPVLSKMMSGQTKYDELVAGRLDTAGKIATAALKVSERQATGHDEIELEKIEREVRAKLDEIDDASRMEKARRDAELDRRTAELAAEFRRLATEDLV
jgi:Domain of unknown function (DUF4407)/Phosphorylase superfamily